MTIEIFLETYYYDKMKIFNVYEQKKKWLPSLSLYFCLSEYTQKQRMKKNAFNSAQPDNPLIRKCKIKKIKTIFYLLQQISTSS